MPTFLDESAVSYWQQLGEQVYSLFMKPLPIYKLKKNPIDPLYKEDSNQEYAEPYELLGYVKDLPQWKQNITKFGTDESRILVAFFSPSLAEKEGKALPYTGDRIAVQGDLYYVSQDNPADYNSNLQLNLSHVVTLLRVRPQKPEQGTVVNKEY